MSLNKGTCVSCGVCRAPRVIVIFNLALPLRLLLQQPSLSGAQGTCMGKSGLRAYVRVCVLVHPVSQACVSAHTHESRHVLKNEGRGRRKEPPLYLRVCVAV